MGRKGLSAVLALCGRGLMALSLSADAIGLGGGDHAFGWEQKLGVAVGMSVASFSAMRRGGWAPAWSGPRPEARSTPRRQRRRATPRFERRAPPCRGARSHPRGG